MTQESEQKKDNPEQSGDDRESPSTRTRTDPYIGRVLGRKYKLKERIGEGGMGIVYLAEQAELGRSVVVKLLNQKSLTKESAIARFRREARGLSRFDHNHIVTIHDFGYEGELSYIVMEYVDGVQLRDLVRHKEGLNLDLFCRIAGQILDAVGEAHNEGIIHRDLKPSNIMLTEKRSEPYFVKVLDFGLAKLVSGDSDVTAQNKVVGSMAYLAPEQIVGDDVDQRADVYALGIVFYFMLTGEKPFSGNGKSLLYAQVHKAPPSLASKLGPTHAIPERMVQLIEACMRKNPAERPKDANVLFDCFCEVIDQTGLNEQLSGPVANTGWSTRRTQRDSVLDKTLGAKQASVEKPDSSVEAVSQRLDIKTPNPLELKWLTAGISLAVVVLVSGGLYYLSQSANSEASREVSRSAQTGILKSIEKAIEHGNLEVAQRKLEEAKQKGLESARDSELDRRLAKRLARRKADRTIVFARQLGQPDDGVTESTKDRTDNAVSEDGTKGILKIDASPRGARVLIDGHSVGTAPIKAAIESGGYTVRVEHDGYEAWSRKVSIKPEAMVNLYPDLRRLSAGHNNTGTDPNDEAAGNEGTKAVGSPEIELLPAE